MDKQIDGYPPLRLGPCLSRRKERRAETTAAKVGHHAKVPDHGQLLAPLQHVQAFRLEGNHRPADSSAINPCRQERPVGCVEAFTPIAGSVPANAVVILHIWRRELTLTQDKTSKATIDNRKIKSSFNLERDRYLLMRRKMTELFLDYLYVHDGLPFLPHDVGNEPASPSIAPELARQLCPNGLIRRIKNQA